MKIKPKPALSPKQEPEPFIISCLPRTMAFAQEQKPLIEPHLKNTPSLWPYVDRVLVWLLPTNFEEDVHKFHEQNGKSMPEILRPHQLEHLDDTLLKKLRLKLGLVP